MFEVFLGLYLSRQPSAGLRATKKRCPEKAGSHSIEVTINYLRVTMSLNTSEDRILSIVVVYELITVRLSIGQVGTKWGFNNLLE